MNRTTLLQIIFTLDELQLEKLIRNFEYKSNVLHITFCDDTQARIYIPNDKHQAICERDYRRLKNEQFCNRKIN